MQIIISSVTLVDITIAWARFSYQNIATSQQELESAVNWPRLSIPLRFSKLHLIKPKRSLCTVMVLLDLHLQVLIFGRQLSRCSWYDQAVSTDAESSISPQPCRAQSEGLSDHRRRNEGTG